MDTKGIISKQLADNRVVLYMKGTPQFPQCGFSALVVETLRHCGLKSSDFFHCNVLLDLDIRQGIKEHANWPTIPQLYINGEFIGGADIVRELHQNGDLQKMIASSSER